MIKSTDRDSVLAEVNAPPEDGDITHGFGEFYLLEIYLEEMWGIVLAPSGEVFQFKDDDDDDNG